VDAARAVDGPACRPPRVGKRWRVFHERPPALIVTGPPSQEEKSDAGDLRVTNRLRYISTRLGRHARGGRFSDVHDWPDFTCPPRRWIQGRFSLAASGTFRRLGLSYQRAILPVQPNLYSRSTRQLRESGRKADRGRAWARVSREDSAWETEQRSRRIRQPSVHRSSRNHSP
jgi:hypothetical protein